MREAHFTYINEAGTRRYDLTLPRPADYMAQWYALPQGDTWFRLKKSDHARLQRGRRLNRRERRVVFDRPEVTVLQIGFSVRKADT